jgi:hypothetical protein
MLKLNRILYEEAINFCPFKVPSQNFLGGTDINNDIRSLERRSTGQNLNPGPSEYKTVTISNIMRRALTHYVSP